MLHAITMYAAAKAAVASVVLYASSTLLPPLCEGNNDTARDNRRGQRQVIHGYL
jgi:hypothetical protein